MHDGLGNKNTIVVQYVGGKVLHAAWGAYCGLSEHGCKMAAHFPLQIAVNH
jgi:hypothetical protein